jgi:hypothetical protein
MVILNEVVDIVKELRKILRRRKKVEIQKAFKRFYQMDDILRPVYTATSTKRKSNGGVSLVAGIIILFAVGFISTKLEGTVAYFSDTESALDNQKSAMSFEINVSATPEESYVGAVEGTVITSTIVTIPEGLPNEYKVTVEAIDGSLAFCQALVMSSSVTPPFVYNGPILDFSSPPTTFSDDWEFEVTLDPEVEGVLAEDICIVDFIYSADIWLEKKGIHGGYSDVERVTLTFHASEGDVLEVQSEVGEVKVLNIDDFSNGAQREPIEEDDTNSILEVIEEETAEEVTSVPPITEEEEGLVSNEESEIIEVKIIEATNETEKNDTNIAEKLELKEVIEAKTDPI